MNVSTLMNEVHNGTVVLPDFQRSFIWEPEDVRELIVSVLGNYFIGSMLTLEQLEKQSPFAIRLIEGVKEVHKEAKIQSIVKVILDGQQRTTALFYALYEPEIRLKNRKNPYKFYLDIEKALEKKWDDAVIAVNVRNKKELNELAEKKRTIPFSLVRHIGKLAKRFKEDPAFEDIIHLANEFMGRGIHIVSLPSDTSLERIVETFERINRTGEPLSVFELVTARLYKDGIKLREIFRETKRSYKFVRLVRPETILRVVALLRGKEPKRKNILSLESENFEKDWTNTCKALEGAYNRATDIKNGYGVLDFKKWMPYTSMLVPLAGVTDYLEKKKLETQKNYEKVDRWYWNSVFSRRYDHAADTKSGNDFVAIKDWFGDDGKIPDFIKKFSPDTVDFDVSSRSSAIYKGVMNLIVLKGALDFKTGQPPQFGKEKIQDDHIFPKSIYDYHRIANRTLISTNAEKWKTKPSEYFKEKRAEHGKERFHLIMGSHLISQKASDHLLKDQLKEFVKEREQAIINELKRRL